MTVATAKATSFKVARGARLSEGELGKALEDLKLLDLGDLRIRYRQVIRKTAPAHLPKWLLLRIVAYRLQEQVLGGLDSETIKFLDGLARSHEAELVVRAKVEAAGQVWKKPAVPNVPALSTRGKLALGTELVREHDGQLHRVTVVRDGYLWKGETYASLSLVARLITGTNWSGPVFFGLRPAGKPAASRKTAAVAGNAEEEAP